mgnify:CR=1 FL=1
MAVEPVQIIAGDSLGWTRDYASLIYVDSSGDVQDCPASTWTLTYYAINKDHKFSIVAEATNDDFIVRVPSTTTQNYYPGKYQWRAFVNQTTTRYEVDKGEWEVLPNFVTQNEFDFRSHAQKVLDAVNAILEGKAETHHSVISIGGRSISEMSYMELMGVKASYENIVAYEKAAEDISKGRKPPSGKILVRFPEWD